MRKFKYQFETLKYPLIIMLIMFFFKGLSNTILSDLVRPYLVVNFTWLVGLMQVLQFFSSFVIQYLPFMIVIKYLTNKHPKTSISLMLIVSYILLLTITMVLGQRNLPAIAYESLFGVSMNISITTSNVNVILMPYRIGLFGAIISGAIVDIAYRATRTRTRYAIFQFIDKEVMSLIYTVLITLVAGLILTYIWPIIIGFLFRIFDWIATDISNPINTFVYGFFDKILSLLDLSSLNRDTFWFNTQGGSWMSNTGNNFMGDVSIWTANFNEGVIQSGFGRFITPYYIINLFAIPGIILGMLSTYTSKRERLYSISFVVVLVVFMIVSDISLPIEIFLFLTAPLLYGIHLFISSALFGLLQGIEVFLGSNLIDGLNNVSLGNGLELFNLFKNDQYKGTVVTILIIGLIVFVLYFFITNIFYRRLAVGLVNKLHIDEYIDEILEIVGGINNIEEIHSTPFRLEIKLLRPQMFNYEALEKSDIARVTETKSIYALYYGTASRMIRNEIMRMKTDLEIDVDEIEVS